MNIINTKFVRSIDDLFNLNKLNTRLVIYARALHSQFALGVFYMCFAGINSVLVERNISGGVGELSEALSISPYYIIVFAYIMAVYCFLRDRLPIYYAIGSVPIALYGVFVAFETINGNIQMTGLLAALYLLTVPYLAIIGVVNRYLLREAHKELTVIKNYVKDLGDG